MKKTASKFLAAIIAAVFFASGFGPAVSANTADGYPDSTQVVCYSDVCLCWLVAADRPDNIPVVPMDWEVMGKHGHEMSRTEMVQYATFEFVVANTYYPRWSLVNDWFSFQTLYNDEMKYDKWVDTLQFLGKIHRIEVERSLGIYEDDSLWWAIQNNILVGLGLTEDGEIDYAFDDKATWPQLVSFMWLFASTYDLVGYGEGSGKIYEDWYDEWGGETKYLDDVMKASYAEYLSDEKVAAALLTLPEWVHEDFLAANQATYGMVGYTTLHRKSDFVTSFEIWYLGHWLMRTWALMPL